MSNKVSFPEVLNVEKYLKTIEEKEQQAQPTSTSEEEIQSISENEVATPPNPNYDYELFSIMIHSGSATGGHYYAYIKCFETNQWYNFNDERVSKIDRDDIVKAYGHSYSTYSSTTAYMLLYRLRNQKRNEKFIRIDEFDEHITRLLDREKNQQLEADRLKEYMENVCKIKVVLPIMSAISEKNSDLSGEKSNTSDIFSDMPSLEEIGKKRIEKTVEVHKDLTLEMAKEQIIKVTIFQFF